MSLPQPRTTTRTQPRKAPKAAPSAGLGRPQDSAKPQAGQSRSNDPSQRQAGPGRPKDLEKRQAVLDAAKRLFLQHGFDGVSMEAIAAEAGVSKLTVYSHYGDKGALFGATIRAKCEEMLPPTLFEATPKGPVRRQLNSIARAFFALVTSPEAIGMHRLMSAQPANDSRLPQMFWEAGPQRVQEGFAHFLQAKVAAGQLAIADVQRAAAQFFCLLKGELHARLSCGCDVRLDARETDAHIRATVEMFLRAYEPRGATSHTAPSHKDGPPATRRRNA